MMIVDNKKDGCHYFGSRPSYYIRMVSIPDATIRALLHY
jgi:hypothetical protein